MLIQDAIDAWADVSGADVFYFKPLSDISFHDEDGYSVSAAEVRDDVGYYLHVTYAVPYGQGVSAELRDGTPIVFLPERELHRLGVPLPQWPDACEPVRSTVRPSGLNVG